jgi:hypothetical protein
VQGYNFKKDKQTPLGHVVSLTIAGVTLAADQSVGNPLTPDSAPSSVVGVFTHVLWETAATDPIHLAFQVSAANRQTLMALLLGSSSTSVPTARVSFVVYEYDPLAKRYFEAYKPAPAVTSTVTVGTLSAVVERQGGDMSISVADDPSEEVQSPRNFAVQLTLLPPSGGSAQPVQIATAVSKKVNKAWGPMTA